MAIKVFTGVGDTAFIAAKDILGQLVSFTIANSVGIEVTEVTNTSSQYSVILKSPTGYQGVQFILESSVSPNFVQYFYNNGRTKANTSNRWTTYNPVEKTMSLEFIYHLLCDGGVIISPPLGGSSPYRGYYGFIYIKELGYNFLSYNGNTSILYDVLIPEQSSEVTGTHQFYKLPNYTIPQPLPNECALSNAIYDGKLLPNLFVYNSNPPIGRYQEAMFGGEKYLTLQNGCCIKL